MGLMLAITTLANTNITYRNGVYASGYLQVHVRDQVPVFVTRRGMLQVGVFSGVFFHWDFFALEIDCS